MRRVTVIPFKGRNVKGQVTRPLNAVTENQPYLKSPLAGGGACCSPHSLLITCIIQYYFAPVSPVRDAHSHIKQIRTVTRTRLHKRARKRDTARKAFPLARQKARQRRWDVAHSYSGERRCSRGAARPDNASL